MAVSACRRKDGVQLDAVETPFLATGFYRRFCSVFQHLVRPPCLGADSVNRRSDVRILIDCRRTISRSGPKLCSAPFWSIWDARFTRAFMIRGSKLVGRERLSQGCDGGSAQSGRSYHSLSGRELRFGLKLAGRCWARSRIVLACSTRHGTRSNTNQFGTNEYMAWCKACRERCR